MTVGAVYDRAFFLECSKIRAVIDRAYRILIHGSPDTAQILEVILDLFAIRGIRRTFDVMFEIADGSAKLPELEAQQAAIAELRDLFRIDHQHHIDDGETFVEGVGLEVNLFQIVQHPPEDLPVRDASEHPL